MTPEQEHDINNALLTLMYEWKIGMIDQKQALKEFKQCLKYYSRMEDVIKFEDNELVDTRRIDHYGLEKVIERVKQDIGERMIAKVISEGCVSFEEVEYLQRWNPLEPTYKRFRMKMQVIIQPQNKKI